MFVQIPLLSRVECEDASAAVNELRPQWIPRTQPASFFTLGVASYMDLQNSNEGFSRDYYNEAAPLNALISKRFGWLLGKAKSVVEDFVGAKALFSPQLASPGFHIFEFPAIPRSNTASIHFDLQHQLINWNDNFPFSQNADVVSFTLPIRLPAGGGGLNIWDITYQNCFKTPNFDLGRYLESNHPTYHRYSLGALAIHSGYRLHQIAGVSDVQPGDQRITLQGHGVCRGSEWVLYW
jgi:hypothetical protein